MSRAVWLSAATASTSKSRPVTSTLERVTASEPTTPPSVDDTFDTAVTVSAASPTLRVASRSRFELRSSTALTSLSDVPVKSGTYVAITSESGIVSTSSWTVYNGPYPSVSTMPAENGTTVCGLYPAPRKRSNSHAGSWGSFAAYVPTMRNVALSSLDWYDAIVRVSPTLSLRSYSSAGGTSTCTGPPLDGLGASPLRIDTLASRASSDPRYARAMGRSPRGTASHVPCVVTDRVYGTSPNTSEAVLSVPASTSSSVPFGTTRKLIATSWADVSSRDARAAKVSVATESR